MANITEEKTNFGFSPEYGSIHAQNPENSSIDNKIAESPEDKKKTYDPPLEIFHQFADNTTIHGLKHTADRSYRPLRR